MLLPWLAVTKNVFVAIEVLIVQSLIIRDVLCTVVTYACPTPTFQYLSLNSLVVWISQGVSCTCKEKHNCVPDCVGRVTPRQLTRRTKWVPMRRKWVRIKSLNAFSVCLFCFLLTQGPFMLAHRNDKLTRYHTRIHDDIYVKMKIFTWTIIIVILRAGVDGPLGYTVCFIAHHNEPVRATLLPLHFYILYCSIFHESFIIRDQKNKCKKKKKKKETREKGLTLLGVSVG